MAWGKEWIADLASGVTFTKISLDKDDALKIEHIEEVKVYLNLKPTHDPYANPDSQIYYECQCGAILDPGTKSFAALNGVASERGWKIRFGADGYVPYCMKCGEGVE